MKSFKRIYGRLPWLMIISVSSLVAACGGSGQDPIWEPATMKT